LLRLLSTLKIEAIRSSKTSVDFHQTTRHYIQEDRIFKLFFPPHLPPSLRHRHRHGIIIIIITVIVMFFVWSFPILCYLTLLISLSLVALVWKECMGLKCVNFLNLWFQSKVCKLPFRNFWSCWWIHLLPTLPYLMTIALSGIFLPDVLISFANYEENGMNIEKTWLRIFNYVWELKCVSILLLGTTAVKYVLFFPTIV
jgi:hypothetical protein